MNAKKTIAKPRWLVPEVVQTSAMDCGPAALKCLLAGFNIPVSYGRLREACQTNIDGTSIDRLEEVAQQLGLDAQQVMLPIDHILLSAAQVLPAMVVVRHADGATHFVVVWRRHGAWLQVMDPAIGRRWVSCSRFLEEIYHHEFAVAATDWHEWAASADFLKPLTQRIGLLGAKPTNISALLAAALAEPDWFGLAKLDAGVRLTQSLVLAGGIHSGKAAVNFLNAALALIDKEDIYNTIPMAYWSVIPQQADPDGNQHLLLKGAVLLQVQAQHAAELDDHEVAPLSAELQAALNEPPVKPMQTLLGLLAADGWASPLPLFGAMTIAVAAVLLETLLFRGIFDMASQLSLAGQRVAAVLALVLFISLLLAMELPITLEAQRFGRHLETRLRMALLDKLPKLTDRYFQSRPISDMAERSHSIALIRLIPNLAIHCVQTAWDIVFTLIAIILLDPPSTLLALIITAQAIALPLLLQPLLNERDLRVRNHAGALFGFYLDALLGLVPIRSHRAELAVRREHEGLLVEWARSSRGLVQLSLASSGLQGILGISLVSLLLYQHFIRVGGVTGADLLLIFWALKLPALGQQLTELAHQYPALRNTLLRLLEPLTSPEELSATPDPAPATAATAPAGVRIDLSNGTVIAGGHTILQDLNLTVAAGEHIAIVGASGAGKSTLAGLLLGWHRLAEGDLWVDGQRLHGDYQQQLRQTTAWVDPAVQLWNSPFLDNLNFSSADPHHEAIADVIDTAALRGVLQNLPQGLQTYLGEGGALLSGGEGQRVRLARALMQEPVRLALLDEPFRGLDRAQRLRLLTEARLWWQQATLLCVTHDVAETLAFPRVWVVDEGRIIEDDNPQVLAARDSRYQALLAAEQRVRENLWQGDSWRRIRISNGVLATDTKAGQDER